MVADALVERWGLGRGRDRYRGRLAEGRVRAGDPGAAGDPGGGTAAVRGPRVAVLCPQTFMNDVGRSVGPARGAFKLPLERVLVVHDEIDLPFGDVRTRLGGADFMRVRVGVGRPDSTDPEIVSAYVLGRFREDDAQVRDLVELACEHVERVVQEGS